MKVALLGYGNVGGGAYDMAKRLQKSDPDMFFAGIE